MIVLEPRLYSQRSLWASVSWSWLKKTVSWKVPLFKLRPLFDLFSWKKCTKRECIRNSGSLVISHSKFIKLNLEIKILVVPADDSPAGSETPSVITQEIFVDLCGMVLTEKENNTVLWKEMLFEMRSLYYFFPLNNWKIEENQKFSLACNCSFGHFHNDCSGTPSVISEVFVGFWGMGLTEKKQYLGRYRFLNCVLSLNCFHKKVLKKWKVRETLARL